MTITSGNRMTPLSLLLPEWRCSVQAGCQPTLLSSYFVPGTLCLVLHRHHGNESSGSSMMQVHDYLHFPPGGGKGGLQRG